MNPIVLQIKDAAGNNILMSRYDFFILFGIFGVEMRDDAQGITIIKSLLHWMKNPTQELPTLFLSIYKAIGIMEEDVRLRAEVLHILNACYTLVDDGTEGGRLQFHEPVECILLANNTKFIKQEFDELSEALTRMSKQHPILLNGLLTRPNLSFEDYKLLNEEYGLFEAELGILVPALFPFIEHNVRYKNGKLTIIPAQPFSPEVLH